MKKLIEQNYQSIVDRGLITNETTFEDFTGKIQEELNELITEGFKGKNMPVELSDIILTCLNMAKHYGIDIKAEMKKKIAINFERAKIK